MLHHIVTWKMNGQTSTERAKQAQEVVAVLAPLVKTVPSVQSLSVHANTIDAEGNWDVILESTFADSAALSAYVVHPEHVAAAAEVKARASARAAVDYVV